MLSHKDPVRPRQFDEPRVWDVLGQVASMIRRDEPVSGPVEDESRAVNERQDMPDVGREEIAKLGRSLTGSRCRPQVPRIPLPEAFVLASARCGN